MKFVTKAEIVGLEEQMVTAKTTGGREPHQLPSYLEIHGTQSVHSEKGSEIQILIYKINSYL